MIKEVVKPNILLVDDKEEGLLALETVLKDLDYNLFKARSGKEALSLLLKTDFSVILLDVQMPEMSGFETATFIKKREKTRNVPIIFVSGLEKDERFVTHGYESGAVDYLFKPFEPQILRSKVSVFVELVEQSRKIKSQAEQLAEAQRQEQARQLERLEIESRTRYRNLADAIPHIVGKASSDFTVDYFNRTWVDYTGLSLEQSFGSGWKSAFHVDDLPKFTSAWQKASEEQRNFEVEARIFRKSHGDYRWHLIKAVPDGAADSTVFSWLFSCTEIHTLKEVESKLIDAKKEADAANRAKSFFLANMSHEIRTPLGAIMGFSDLLLQEDAEPHAVSDYAATIKRNGEQLLKIIDEILDISKVESGSLQLTSERVDLVDLVSSVESYLKLQAARKSLPIQFEIEGEVPEHFYSDATRVKQILTNIVGNAVKFSNEGAIKVTICASKELGPSQIQFIIKDDGPGIDEQYLDAIFRPFSQGDSSTSRKYGGTGLGLALSRKLARALDGDVELTSSKKGVGSTFTVSLATHLTEKVPMITELKRSTPSAQTSKVKNSRVISSGLEGVKVLVADDAPENQRLISWFLEKAGAEVDLAQDGKEAIDKALAGDHDLILMDIQMPGVDGYQATQTLRKQGYNKPILAVTAHALVEERQRCLEAGCTDHFSKPIDPHRLVERVTHYSATS